MTCEECVLWDIDSAKDAAVIVRNDWAARCLWVSKEQYPLSMPLNTLRLKPGYMMASDGHGCPCFIKREK